MTDTRHTFGIADAALILTTFLWGLNAVITKNAVGDSPESFRMFIFNGLRIPAGSLLLFCTIKLSGGTIGIKRQHIPLIMSVAFFGMFLFMTAFVCGIYLTSAANVGVINATIPLLILLVSFLSKIDKPSGRTVSGIVIGFSGVLALSWKNGAFGINPGDVIILLACVSWAIYTVYAKKILDIYPPVLAVAWVYLFTSLYQLPLFLYQLGDQSWNTVSTANWINLAISIVFSLFLANSLYYFSISRIGPARTGVYTNLTPVFTILLAVLIRGEAVNMVQIAGLTVIIIGIIIARSGKKPVTSIGKKR